MNSEKQPTAHVMDHLHAWHIEDFEEMWRVIVERKGLIISISGLVVLVALAYVMLVPPVYKAEAYLLPPMQKDIMALDVQGLDNQKYSPQEIYEIFIRNLGSRKQQAVFFAQYKSVAQGDFEIVRPKNRKRRNKEDNENVKVVLHSMNAQGGDAVNAFVKMAGQKTVNDIVQGIMDQVSVAKRDLANQISIKRDKAQLRRNKYISRLTEAIELAGRLGLVENSLLRGGIPERDSRQYVGPFPMYLRGVKALRAEKEIIQERKDNDLFGSGLIRLKEKMAELESVKIDEARISVVTVDQEARVPGKSIKPKAKHVLILSLFAGLILGMFAAFYAEYLSKTRKGLVNT